MSKKDKKKQNDDYDDFIPMEIQVELPMINYEIWQKGFELFGKICEDTLLGEAKGTSFQDACMRYFRGDIKFNSKKMTYFGSELYGKEKEENED